MLKPRQVCQLAESGVREPFRATKVERRYMVEPADALHQGVGHLAFDVQAGNPVLLQPRYDGIPVSRAAGRLFGSPGAQGEKLNWLNSYRRTVRRHRSNLLHQGWPV